MNLFDIPLVSLLLSVVISWALFAMLCSLVHEAVAQLKAERGRFMKRYLFQQLQDLPNGINWASLLYQHGTIEILSRDPSKPTNDISPHLFAEALIEAVGGAQLIKIQATATGITSNYNSAILHHFDLATRALQNSDTTAFFRQSLRSAELSAAAGGLPVTEGQVYNQLVTNIEKWYCEFQERLTLWYKKATRQRLFILGVVLGLLLNVDTIQLFKIYNANPQARQAVISYYQQNAARLTTPADSVASGNDTAVIKISISKPISQYIDSTLMDTLIKEVHTTMGINTAKEKQALAFAKQLDSLSQANGLPIGTPYSFVLHPRQDPWDWFYKILGVLISGFAASLGAPFWFSLLQKAISKK